MAVKTEATYHFSFPTLGDMANAVVKEVSHMNLLHMDTFATDN